MWLNYVLHMMFGYQFYSKGRLEVSVSCAVIRVVAVVKVGVYEVLFLGAWLWQQAITTFLSLWEGLLFLPSPSFLRLHFFELGNCSSYIV